MITEEQRKVYEGFEPYKTKSFVENPLLGKISIHALIAWFRCNSCYTCAWRNEVIDKDIDPDHNIEFCSMMHESFNIIDMVSYLGYSKEGRERDIYPRYEGEKNDE